MRRTLLLGALLVSGVASAEPTANVPLNELLRLYKLDDASKESDDKPPPVEASVSSIDLEGRLLDGAIELTAQFEVSVLEDRWVAVRLFPKDERTTISHLPSVPEATFSVVDGYLVLLTQKASSFHFEIVMRRSVKAGARQRVELDVSQAAQVTLKLHVDENLFRLVSIGGTNDGDAVMLYPEGGRFVVEWERLAIKQQAPRQRPPIESVITSANASIVSTLAGSTVTRIAYDLRLEGTHPIDFKLPEGESLQRVYVNGASVAASQRDGIVHLDVAPARAGDDQAHVELVTEHDQAGYALSGKLEFVLPSSSWRCNELFATLHLPQAFDYRWDDGSLALVEEAPEASYSYAIPTPGKAVRLHQQLVQRAPFARVNYSVDLEGNYYK
jgi:hypothetical protein